MSGLRAQQKKDRDRRILEAASALFRSQGYGATHIEQIAESAGLSVGTLYNYYKNKGDLLVAIVSIEVHDVLAAGAALVKNPPDDVALALDALVAIYYDHSLVYLDKSMWRHAVAMTTLHSETPSGQAYTALDRALADQVTAMIAGLQARDRVRADLAPDPIGALVFNNLDRMFQTFIRDEAMSLEALKATVAVHHAILAQALALR